MSDPTQTIRSTRARELGLGVLLSLLGLPLIVLDPERGLAWAALLAPAVGGAAAALGLAPFSATLIPPGAWLAVLVFSSGVRPSALPTPFWAALALLGLVLAGWALGRLLGAPPARAGGLLTLLTCSCAALPAGGGWLSAPWPPRLAARALDGSPVVLLEECAGVDWMRHAAVYDPVGTHSIGPELRLPYRGRLAGPVTLLVGCTLAVAGRRRRAARR